MLSLLTCATPCVPHSPLLPPSIIKHAHLQNQSSIIAPHDIKRLKSIHHHDTHVPTKSNLLLFNVSLQFYVNLGLMQEARELFDEMPERTLISWTILMSGYTRHGPVTETLALFEKMMQDDTTFSIQPDSFVYAIVLRACSAIGNVYYGRGIHCRILKIIALIDSFVENALVTMYASCGSISDSIRVFDGILLPDLVSWSSMLSGYVQNGLEEEGLRLFVKMAEAGIKPDVFALSMFIGASANLGRLGPGIQVHCSWIKMGLDYCLFLENCLIDFYARCGDPGSSEKVFNQMPRRNLVSYNAIINGYVHNFHYVEALSVFRALMNEDFNCDEFTLAGVLQAVIGLGALDLGREIHGYIIRVGLESNHYVISSLLETYIECTEDHESSNLRNHVPPKIFNRLDGGESDKFIIASVLKWCSLQLDLESGKLFHTRIIKNNLQTDPYVVSSLIDMYSKCGIPEAAFMVFARVKGKGVVPWSVIIAGYCWNGWFDQALRLFQRMQFNFVEANEYTYTSILLACSALGDFRKIKELHCRILQTGYESNISVMKTLIYVYTEFLHHRQALALCSLIPEAEISWDLLIQACERVGQQVIILKLLHGIQKTNGKLDTTSVCCILNSCAEVALLNVGTQVQAYLIKRGLISDPSANNSLIKMYSKCGTISEAFSAFNSMHKKNSDTWTLIISANVEHGHPAKAMTLFSQMRRKNKSMSSTTFTSIFKACAQMGLVQEAFRLFMSMDKVYGIEPSMEHYTCVVEVLGRAGMFEDAQEFINGVIPFKPVSLIWRALLSTSRVHGNMKVAKYSAEKILSLEPNDFETVILLQQVLLTEGKWNKALNLKRKRESVRVSSSWIEIRNRVYRFASNEGATKEIYAKLLEIEHEMEELGYVAERNHSLHNSEELSCGVGYYHTEMKALAFGLLVLLPGTPMRVVKSVRMCGECHSAFKFMSTFLGRELIVKDSCNFHHFINGKCSCRDAW